LLENKVAVVTGGSRGIGRAIAIQLAKSGADVAIFFSSNQEAADETLLEVQKVGQKGLSFKVDVSSSSQVESAMKEVLNAFGRIDILVNNAGVTKDNLLVRMKEEDWDRVIDTNLKGVFLCTKAVARTMMKKRSGRIINISSVVGVAGNAGQANYVAAKAGVIGLTKSIAKELAAKGVNVNAVAPGFITTDMTSGLDEETKEKLLKEIPLQRFGDPLDIAKVVTFLASDGSSYITGQTIHVDGGMVIS
jgi:3-oxoacyl-[acyl-carrier protein] reductase